MGSHRAAPAELNTHSAACQHRRQQTCSARTTNRRQLCTRKTAAERACTCAASEVVNSFGAILRRAHTGAHSVVKSAWRCATPRHTPRVSSAQQGVQACGTQTVLRSAPCRARASAAPRGTCPDRARATCAGKAAGSAQRVAHTAMRRHVACRADARECSVAERSGARLQPSLRAVSRSALQANRQSRPATAVLIAACGCAARAPARPPVAGACCLAIR